MSYTPLFTSDISEKQQPAAFFIWKQQAVFLKI
jgi:hypothetical protein